MNTFNLTLDLDKEQGLPQLVTLRQGDKSGTQLVATIYDHGQLVSGSYTARVSLRHPGSGDTYYRETATYSGGVATVTVDEQYAATVAGVTTGYFELLQGSTVKASTADFIVRILPSAEDGAVPGEVYDSAIEDALDELDAATGRISQMVVDATAEYLAAHPEITTTVQDNSVTDAKLIQSGGVLDRVGRLWWRLENLLTATPAEAESVTVADAAKTPVAGLTVYGKSTQDGTPTPDAPVAIQSVSGNLLDPSTFMARGGGVDTIKDGFVSDSTPTSDTSGWSWAHRTFDVTLPAGMYTVCFFVREGGGTSATYAVMTDDGTTIKSATSGFEPHTFTIDKTTNVGIKIKTYSAVVACMVFAGRVATNPPCYVPYDGIGLHAHGRNLLNPSNGFSNKAFYTVNADGSVTVTDGDNSLWPSIPMLALPAGTFTLSVAGNAVRCAYHVIDGTSDEAYIRDGNFTATFTIASSGGIKIKFYSVSSTSIFPFTVKVMVNEGSTATAFTPYAESVTPIPLDGHVLRSLPDGTRDEVTVDQYGHVTLVQRVGSVTLDGSSDENYNLSGNKLRFSYTNASDVTRRAPNGNTIVQLLSDRFVAETSNQNYSGNVGASIGSEGYIGLCRTGAAITVAAEREWLASNPVTVDYPLATPVTHDLGTIDPTALVGPDMTAQAVPTAPFALTYERDLNTTLARLEAALATLA